MIELDKCKFKNCHILNVFINNIFLFRIYKITFLMLYDFF